MSDNDTQEFEGHETDWLANSVHGYGYGYTKQQALASMARYANVSRDEPLPVMLVEHVGSATLGMGRVDVDHFVDGEEIEVDMEDMQRLHDAAVEANIAAERALENADVLREDLSE